MGAALPIAAIAMSAIAPVIEGIGANSEARGAARVDDENARLSLLSGEQDAEQIMRDERMIAGDALAMMGGSGLAIGTGSAADLLVESARAATRDVDIRRQQARGERDNYTQAAKDKRRAGRNAIIGGVFGGVAQALGGVNGIRNDRKRSRSRAAERTSIRND